MGAPQVSTIVTKEEVAKNDYNLSPTRHVADAEEEEVVPLEEAVVLLQEAEEEREEADGELDQVLSKLGLEVRQLG
jgi:type I restriction enzyme M protein